MLRIILSFFLIVVFVPGLQAQLAYERKQSNLSLTYGVHNIWKQLFKESIISNYYASLKSKGPLSITYDYALHRKISAGITLAYSNLKARSVYGSYENNEKLTNFSVLGRASYHIIIKEKWDGYAGAGAGYYRFNYSSVDNAGGSNGGSGIKVPGAFGYTGHGGIRYFFSKDFAAMAELGFVAGSYGQVGISYKF